MTMTGAQSRLRAVLLASVAIAVAAPALALATPAHDTHRADKTMLRDLGALPEPAAKSERKYPGSIANVDAAARRMYFAYVDPDLVAHVVTYDLRPTIPRPIASGVIGPSLQLPDSMNPYVVALDTKRHHLIFRGANINEAGQFVQSFTTTLLVYDTRTNKPLPEWRIPTKLPGFEPAGITYSARDDMLYMVGDFSGSGLVNGFTLDVVNPVASVVAVDPASGDVVWIKPIPGCQKVLNNQSSGGPLFHSDTQPTLYFVCVTGSSLTTVTYAQSGLVRLTIDPHARSEAAVKDFRADFFPISGQYFNGADYGVAAFDHRTDRFFLQSMAIRTPGAWVFDGRRSAWVGFVPAPEYTNKYIGFNEGLGRLYMGMYRTPGDPTNGLVIANARQTPVPAGLESPMTTSDNIVADSGSRRLFVLPEGASESLVPYRVVEDTAPKARDADPLDFDSLTSRLPESQASYVNYSGDADGYGVNLALVGGTAGPLSVGGNIGIPSPVDSGSRGIRLAQVSGLGIRTAGASASAQALVADVNTTHDYETSAKQGSWPYTTASCLDSGGGVKPQQADFQSSSARVACDLEHARATGTADATGVTTAAVHVGHADSVGTVQRTTKQGSTTTVAATSSGIRVDIPAGGALHVGHVTASMTTRAHGVAGTTAATYTRSIRGVTVTDGKGNTVFGPEACTTTIQAGGGAKPRAHDTCSALVKAIHPYIQNRVWLTFPMPETSASPKGAYATVQQSERDYLQERTVNDQGVLYPKDSTAVRPAPALQVEIFNDQAERSRLLAQFAAVQGDSVFTTSGQGPDGEVPPLGSQPTDTNGNPTDRGQGDGGATGPVDPGTDRAIDTADAPTTPPAVALAPTSGLAGWLFVHRSLRDALLLGSLLALAAGAVLLAFRRQRLLTAMTVTTERPSS
jgi:hypothetical protein